MILQNFINHKLNMNNVKGYPIKWEKRSECMHRYTKLILIIHVHFLQLLKKCNWELTEMCHWYPPTESQILKHNHNIQFVGGKRTKGDKYLPSKVLKHRWCLSFFSPVTWIDARWTAGVISNYMKLCGVGLLSRYRAGPAVIKGRTPYRMNNQCSL